MPDCWILLRKVVIQGFCSANFNVAYGVPQESVLGS